MFKLSTNIFEDVRDNLKNTIEALSCVRQGLLETNHLSEIDEQQIFTMLSFLQLKKEKADNDVKDFRQYIEQNDTLPF